MSLKNLIQDSKRYFPDLKVRYKNESILLRCLSVLCHKNFINHPVITVGSTIYFPSRLSVRVDPIQTYVAFMGELLYVKSIYKISKFFLPQILFIISITLLFINWKFIFLYLFLLPPTFALFRVYFEKKVYFVSLYAAHILGKKLKFNPALDLKKEDFKNQFKNSSYYAMYLRSDLDKEFSQTVKKIKLGQHPFDDSVFDILDDLSEKITYKV